MGGPMLIPPGMVNPGFPFQLGTNVGRRLPPVGVPPVGNINSPGLPGRWIAPIPNINSPGGVFVPPLPYGPFYTGQSYPLSGRPISGYGAGTGVVVYSVPYATPTTVIYVVQSAEAAGVPAEPALPPEPRAPAGPSSYILEYQAPSRPAEEAPAPPARPVTLLAFKDQTLLAVTDYWLEGYQLVYETNLSVRTAVPLDRLDLPLTQQLNRQRNTRFVLEARP